MKTSTAGFLFASPPVLIFFLCGIILPHVAY